MRPWKMPVAALAGCTAACDPCPVRPVEYGAWHYKDEAWQLTRHNLIVQVFPDRMPFDLLLEAMESIDAEFRCFPEDQQRGYGEYGCYYLKLPWDVCWPAAEDHFDDTHAEGFAPMTVAWVADAPEDRCDCSWFELR